MTECRRYEISCRTDGAQYCLGVGLAINILSRWDMILIAKLLVNYNKLLSDENDEK